MNRHPPLPLLAAEAFGAFLIVLLGCGAGVVGAAYPGSIPHLGVALAFGLAVTLGIVIALPWGGGDLNPAVSLARALTGDLPWRRAASMVLAQFLGGLLAAMLLTGLFPKDAHLAATTSDLPWWQAGLIEAILTFVLVCAARSSKPPALAWVAGGVVALDALVGGPLTGASMNPARSLGPASANLCFGHDSRAMAQYWLYAAGPALGALIAFLLPLTPGPTPPNPTAST